jgi:hypothetical protein
VSFGAGAALALCLEEASALPSDFPPQKNKKGESKGTFGKIKVPRVASVCQIVIYRRQLVDKFWSLFEIENSPFPISDILTLSSDFGSRCTEQALSSFASLPSLPRAPCALNGTCEPPSPIPTDGRATCLSLPTRLLRARAQWACPSRWEMRCPLT